MSGEIVSLIVILGRLLVPFAMFRWPLGGMLASIAADASDVMIFEATGYGYFGGIYHHLDKILDIYYLFVAWLVARRWDDGLARRAAGALFWWRAAGVAAFEATGFRPLFLLAPSVFENFYLFRVIAVKAKPAFTFTARSLIIVLIAVGTPKLAQEYLMHVRFIDQTWGVYPRELLLVAIPMTTRQTNAVVLGRRSPLGRLTGDNAYHPQRTYSQILKNLRIGTGGIVTGGDGQLRPHEGESGVSPRKGLAPWGV